MSGSEPVRTVVARPSASRSKHDPLALAQHPEDRALERVGGEHELGAVGVAHDDALARRGSNILTMPCMSGAYGFCTLPALRQEVQTFTRFGRAVHDRADPLDVRVPAPLGAAVRVAEAHAEDAASCRTHRRRTPSPTPLTSDVAREPESERRRLAAAAVPSRADGGPADARAPPICARRCCAFRDALRAHQEELNRLNVYPVPDGDTGTNMALTLESVSAELARRRESMDEVCHAISRGSLMGARGNSGVILSQILRGLADDVPRRSTRSTAPTLVAGLRRARRRRVRGGACARSRARSSPSCATAAEAVEQRSTASRRSSSVLERGADAARDAVARTPELLPVLRDAGVVDAGGKGFTLLLDAFLEVVDGRPIPEPEVVTTPAAVAAHLARRRRRRGLRYEVMYLLDADDDTIAAFQRRVGRDRRLDRRRRRRRPLELPRPHQRHRRRGRGRHRRRAARARSASPTCIEQVEEERWVREAEVVADLDGAPIDARRSRPRSSRSASATACAACSRASACSRSSRAGSR